jgi:hypothetical protein
LKETEQDQAFSFRFHLLTRENHIGTCLDHANPFVSPVSVPYTIGLAYGAMIWGFATNTISTNLAGDLGTRIVAAIFFSR